MSFKGTYLLSSPGQRSAASWLLLAALAATPAAADTFVIDFDANDTGYSVTIDDDGASNLAATVRNGRLEITGLVAAGSEPKINIDPDVRIDASDSWSVEATFYFDDALFPLMNTQDSLQSWVTVQNAMDSDDDVRAKTGNLKGDFFVGPMLVTDGFFGSSGYIFDADDEPGSNGTTEYSVVDPALAGPTAPLASRVRIDYDAATGLMRTLYRVGAGPFIEYPIEDGAGNPAPDLEPDVDWRLAPGDELVVTLLFSATRAAVGGPITSSFTLQPGEVFFDDIVLTGTLVPEPSAGLMVIVGGGFIGLRSRRRRARPQQPSSSDQRPSPSQLIPRPSMQTSAPSEKRRPAWTHTAGSRMPSSRATC